MDYPHKPYLNSLRIIRENAGYQQKHVAARLGLSETVSISQWENGRAMPNGANLIKLCVLYRKNVRDLYPEHVELIEREFFSNSTSLDGGFTTHTN